MDVMRGAETVVVVVTERGHSCIMNTCFVLKIEELLIRKMVVMLCMVRGFVLYTGVCFFV